MLKLIRRSSAKEGTSYVAICVYPQRLDVAKVRFGDEKPVVETLESYETGKDLRDALMRLRKKFGLKKSACTTLLDAPEYQVLQISTPLLSSPDECREDALAKVQGMIETPIAHVTVDILDIPTAALAPGRTENSYAVVAGNAAIAPKVQVFHAAGVPLKVIDIPELAQRNVARYCEQKDRALAMLAFGERDGLLTFTCNGDLFMFRRIEVGLSQLRTEDMDRRSSLFDRIGLEVQRSMDNFDRQYGFLPLSRLVIGPYGDSVPLQGYLRDYLAITVDILDFSEILDFPAVPELKTPERQGECFYTIGAALRQDPV